jgi:WD40 repeat protein/DNA-binding SARP family transcriptional activator
MQIRVLGNVEASVEDRPLPLGGAKQKALLAMLGLEANQTVTADRLIEGLWGEAPPPSAAKMVQNYVWRLRKVLADDGGAEILTHGRGYELRIDPELVDVSRVERLVAEGSAREALALFHGAPLGDLAGEPFAPAEIRRLEELRERAAELAIDADLTAGRHREVLGELDALLAANPWRERLHAQRMLALYRCGRQADALEAYREARRALVEEVGIEPGPELRKLHEAILRQDPNLEVELAVAELPRELETEASPPLIGRDGELRRLRARWERAAGGTGALVAVVGAYGMGKTRLAAELAAGVHREDAPVVYATGMGAPETALAAITRARDERRPTLFVLDDADRAPVEVRAALRELAPALSRLPVLVLATGLLAAALARLEPRDTIVLEPLGADAVEAIASRYAPADGEVPVDALLATSDGVARRVHEAAGEWARREAMRRVDVVADRAASGRSEARALEAELAGSVVELQSARERTELLAREGEAAPLVCPYKGLATFDFADAEYFFGREQLVAELVARLVGAPLLGVVGPSGSGKSSVVRAGLLPALAGGVLPGSDGWARAVIRPGEHPLAELRRAARKLAREQGRLLVVDQFEELFTACRDEDERAEFVEGLVRRATDRDGRTVVALVIRADFYGRCADYPGLSALLGANHVLVGPMSRDELRRAIERPAQRVGLSVEPELVDALLADVEGQPGALPLLSTALLELWRESDRPRLRLATYARSGGVEGAVARLAEAAFVGLEPERQAIARTLLLRLADEDESGATVRRRIALDDLDDAAAVVAGHFADRRLLTVSDGTVEVAHEALLREWPRLRGWLDEDAQGRRVHRTLGAAARAWEADGRDPGGLYRGARLAAALDWAAGHDAELDATERAFLTDSRRTSGRAQRRLRMALAGVTVLLGLAVIAGAIALDQRGNARAEATAAAAQGLGAQALGEDQLDRALLLARQGVALDDTLQTRGNLLTTLLRSPAAVGIIRSSADRLVGVALSPDQRTLAMIGTSGDTGTLSFVDTATRRVTPAPDKVTGLDAEILDGPVFSSDGSRVAVPGDRPVVVDARTHQLVVRLLTSETEVAYRLRFSPDRRTLYAAIADPGTGAGTLKRFDARTGRPFGDGLRIGPWRDLVTLDVLRDGRIVTSLEDGSTAIRDARTLRVLARLPVGADYAAPSPNDRTLLVGRRDGSVGFLDLVTGRVRPASGRHQGAVVHAAFSPDGRTAVTAGEDDRVIVWDVGRAAARETLTGHAGRITGMALSRDNSTLYTSSLDGTAVIWDLAGSRRLGHVFTTPANDRNDEPRETLRSDGRVLALGEDDGTVLEIDAQTLRPIARFRVTPKGAVSAVGFAPHSATLVVGGDDGSLTLVDSRRGTVMQRLSGHVHTVSAITFSADGSVMATMSWGDNSVLLWQMRGGRPTGRPDEFWPSFMSTDAELSPDGRLLAIANGVGIDIIDVATHDPRAHLPGSGHDDFSARFTPDGQFVSAVSQTGRVRLWSTKTWRPVAAPIAGHAGATGWQSVSPDSATLATGGVDGTIRLYDLRTQQPLGPPLPAVPNHSVAPQFSPDGAYLFAITDAGRSFRWNVRPSSWSQRACAVAGRRLTRAEWRDALPGRAYAPAC